MDKKTIMLVNDLPGVGKVALGAMLPILSYMGYSVHNLPTALVSNTLDYGKFNILDSTEHMKKTVHVWKELGFKVDAIATGFIASEKQIPIIEELMEYHADRNPLVMVDPIMGDNGSLYNGLSESLFPLMRHMVSKAHVVIPNLTEAYFLTRRKVPESGLPGEEELRHIGEDLLDLGTRSFIITSVKDERGHSIYGYDGKKKQDFRFYYKHLPVNFPGTGDVFSAVLLGNLLRNKDLETAARTASDFIYRSILANREYTKDTREGLFIENHLHLLNGIMD